LQRYILRRLTALPVIIISVSIITFFVLRSPLSTDPAVLMTGQNAQPAEVARARPALGLDKPVIVQFGDWLSHMARGDFGRTFRGGQPVWPEVKRRFPVTFEEVSLALAFGTLFGLLYGIIAAVKYNTPIDYGLRLFAVFGQSIPGFFLMVLLIVIPSLLWHYAPPSGAGTSLFSNPIENLRLFVPPTLMLAVAHSAGLLRLTRTTLVEVLQADYIRTATAKGLQRRTILVRHALRNSMVPLITIRGARVAELFFGSLILEQIFNINGLGQFFFQSTIARDLPVMQFLVVYSATIHILLNLAVDVSYVWLDPRVRYV
jgi:peptide/nickel transport system permease protein